MEGKIKKFIKQLKYPKKKRIKMWEEAIDKTIMYHQFASMHNLDYANVLDFVGKVKQKTDVNGICELCTTSIKLRTTPRYCDVCIWVKFTGASCLHNKDFDYKNNEESIKRLELWRKNLKSLKEQKSQK